MPILFLGNPVAIWERKKVSLDCWHVQKTYVFWVNVKNGEIPRPRALKRNLHNVFSLWPVLQ